MNDRIIIPKALEDEMWQLEERLFPIYRTLMGKGFEASLKIISQIIPLQIIQIPTGTSCGSWTVPQQWEIVEATVTGADGCSVMDFSKNTFHIWQYSTSFEGKVSRDELLEHIVDAPSCPEAVPLAVTYYKKRWGICLSAEQKKSLADQDYEVNIKTVFSDGNLLIGQYHLPGMLEDEILIDAVLSCGALANNLSGVVVATYLAKLIAQLKERKYSYRILFTPETIGPIAWFYQNRDASKKILGGYNLSTLGDHQSFHYKKSRQGNTIADRAMIHVLNHVDSNFRHKDYDVMTGHCGNEKAYNSLGIEIPMGAISRSPLGTYPEYDTSSDDLGFVDKRNIFASLQLCWEAIQAIENNKIYKHTFTGEPFLTGYGLFPKIEKDEDRIPYDYLMGFTNGDLDLIHIAEKAGLPISHFLDAAIQMKNAGLLEEI